MKSQFHMESGARQFVGRCRWLLGLFLYLALLALPAGAQGDVPTVGIEGQLEVLLPGPELKAKPAERHSPVTVRIASTRPHGTLIQYDLRYIGLVPGRHDLRAYLLRQDGSPAEDLPPIEVQVAGLLPQQQLGQITVPRNEALASFGGYRWVIGGLAALWAFLAIPLLLVGRRPKDAAGASVAEMPPTLAERLRPLVESASAGTLSTAQKAELERLLLGHWRQRLGLEELNVSDALTRLRKHPEAGALLKTLEDWLHRPPGAAQVDVDSVLSVYAKPDNYATAEERPVVHSSAL